MLSNTCLKARLVADSLGHNFGSLSNVAKVEIGRRPRATDRDTGIMWQEANMQFMRQVTAGSEPVAGLGDPVFPNWNPPFGREILLREKETSRCTTGS